MIKHLISFEYQRYFIALFYLYYIGQKITGEKEIICSEENTPNKQEPVTFIDTQKCIDTYLLSVKTCCGS